MFSISAGSAIKCYFNRLKSLKSSADAQDLIKSLIFKAEAAYSLFCYFLLHFKKKNTDPHDINFPLWKILKS